MTPLPIVFLVDVDNTLIDNDRIQNDLKRHLEREFGAACRDRYWAILEQLFTDLGYRDYLGALQRYPAEHYVLVDDKLRILTTVKRVWKSRVTTVFPRQGQYAHDRNIIAECPPADLTVERIGDLLNYDLAGLLAG